MKSITRKIAAVLTVLLMMAVFFGCKEEPFSYRTSDMSRYVMLKRADYVGVPVTLTGSYTVTDASVDSEVITRLKKIRYTDKKIEDGDTAYIYFRGVTTDNGTETDFNGGSNMTSSAATDLVIGSDSFIPGFETGLIGVVPNTTSFVRRTTGATAAADILYMTYTLTYTDTTTGTADKSYTARRIDLSSFNEYGPEFNQKLVGLAIGENQTFLFDYDMNGNGTKDTVAVSAKILQATEEKTVAVEATFPVTYANDPTLAGKTVKFYVIVDYMTSGKIPEVTAENIAKVGFESIGVDPVSEYKTFVRSELTKTMEEKKRSDMVDPIWKYMDGKAAFKKLPATAVAESIEDIRNQLDATMKQWNTNYPAYAYDTLDEFVQVYYSLDEDVTLGEFLNEQAEYMVKEKIIFYYIAAQEKLWPNEEALQAEVDQFLLDYVNEYNSSYGTQITQQDILDAYSQAYIEESIVYQKVMDFLTDHAVLTVS